MSQFSQRTTPRRPGTADVFAIGDRVRRVEGRTDLGREGVVSAVNPVPGGDILVVVDGGEWNAYDRQLEKVAQTTINVDGQQVTLQQARELLGVPAGDCLGCWLGDDGVEVHDLLASGGCDLVYGGEDF